MPKVAQIGDYANDDELVLIPEGKYTMTYVRHAVVFMWGGYKLFVIFKVIDYGEHFGKKVARYYNCKKHSNRKITARPNSDLQREFSAVTGIRRKRGGVIPITALKDVPVVCHVETVRKDRRQRELHEINCYSRISEVIKKAEL